MTLETPLREQLATAVSGALRDDPEALALYGRDRSTAWPPAPAAVVWPHSTAETLAVVRLANRHGLPLVPSAGRTGLSGGAVAARGEIVVSLERMNRILGVDRVDRCLRCEAGVILADVQRAAVEHDLFYPVDYASSGSALVGGSIATNGGGIRVIRYGMTRQWVAGLTVVTGAGEVLELNGSLVKNNAGYDLRQLFIGSEGTLGIITGATLRLAEPPPPAAVMVLALPRLAAALEVLERCRARLGVSAFEFFSDSGLRHAGAMLGTASPVATPAPYYVLAEFDSDGGDEAAAQAVFAGCLDAGIALDGVLAGSIAQARSLWRLRESMSEALAPLSPRKYDVAVPVHAVPAFAAELERGLAGRSPGLECVLWGHIGDGNLHINLPRPAGMDRERFRRELAPLSAWIADLVAAHGGSISAEHGIGLEKRDYLDSTRSAEEIALMRAIKAVLDPRNLMNPGKLFPDAAAGGATTE